MGTRNGTIKKTELSAYSNPRAGGIIAMGIDEGDGVIAVQLSDGQSEIFIGTRQGMAIRFPEDDVRPMGRTAYGVRGITLREGDEVVAGGFVGADSMSRAAGVPTYIADILLATALLTMVLALRLTRARIHWR